MKASARHTAANAVMMLDSVTIGDSELRAYGWLLPYEGRSVSGFEVKIEGHSAPAVWQQHDSPDVAQVMRNVPGSERARFDLRADFRAIRRRNSTGMVRATLDDGSQTFAMFPIASDIPIPDERLAGMIGGYFSEVGFAFLAPLIQFGGLRQDAAVLDAGCGCGRIAYGLAHYLSQQRDLSMRLLHRRWGCRRRCMKTGHFCLIAAIYSVDYIDLAPSAKSTPQYAFSDTQRNF